MGVYAPKLMDMRDKEGIALLIFLPFCHFPLPYFHGRGLHLAAFAGVHEQLVEWSE
jgi:hypothetical protein